MVALWSRRNVRVSVLRSLEVPVSRIGEPLVTLPAWGPPVSASGKFWPSGQRVWEVRVGAAGDDGGGVGAGRADAGGTQRLGDRLGRVVASGARVPLRLVALVLQLLLHAGADGIDAAEDDHAPHAESL